MINIKNNTLFFAVILTAFLVVGCIVSGTFIVTEEFTFTTMTGFYHYDVDVTDEEDWQDHKDDIQNIDAVGFELWFTNNSGSDVTFNVWLDDGVGATYEEATSAQNNLNLVLDDVTLPPGKSHLSYVESLGKITNFALIKSLASVGKFKFYGVSSNTTDSTWIVDSGIVYITFTANGS